MTTYEQIMKHLGGHRFTVMTGAKVYAAGEMGATFSIPRNLTDGEYTHIRFLKRPMDSFEIQKLKINGRSLDPVVVDKTAGILPEFLAKAFEEFTGLYVKL